MIVFLVDKVTARWEYTFDFIFGLRGISYELTDDIQQFQSAEVAKWKIPNDFGHLLSETGISQKNTSSGTWEGEKCVSFDGKADIISSIFFILTRMEEYGAHDIDEHGRFSARKCWQFKNECLDKVVCDRWALAFIQWLEKEVRVSLSPKTGSINLIPTFDIDNVFAYKHKKGWRKLLSITKDLLTRNLQRRNERKAVLSDQKPDPYDGYDKILTIAESFTVRLFWLVGDYAPPDYNIPIEQKEIQTLVGKLKNKVLIGIHPSYRSNRNPRLVKEEIQRLEKVIGEKVTISRQHFLKLDLALTYPALINQGIKEDYTMGFADAVGFRNGTAHAFPWFDLNTNQKTDLIIRPFAYMDGTLNEYLLLSPERAEKVIEKLYQEVKAFGGDFIFLWHNETITDHGIWEGWSKVLDFTLNLSKNEKQ